MSCEKNTEKFNENISNESNRYVTNILSNIKIKSQKIKSRKFISTPKKIKEIAFNNLFNPASGCVYDNNLFIVDASSMLIHKISLNDTNYVVFGKGTGRGPGELITISDMQCSNSKIYISDPSKQTIEVYSVIGKYIKTIKLSNTSPEKFIIDNKNENITVYNFHDNTKFFYKFNSDGILLKKFGSPLIMRHINSTLYHDNILCKLSNHSFLQIPLRLGIMGYYSNDSLKFIKETIDGIRKEPNDIIYGENYVRTDRKKIFYTCIIASSNKKNILLESIKTKNGKMERYCDIYDKQTLEYLYSFEQPFRTFGILLFDEYFITYDNEKITIFEFKGNTNEK